MKKPLPARQLIRSTSNNPIPIISESEGNAMEGRKCPSCGKVWYSASSGPWECDKCGAVIPPYRELKLKAAIEYFEDAIKESDEIIDDCYSEDLKKGLLVQKEHFVIALKAMKDVLRYE